MKTKKEKIPEICITCQNYEPYHCKLYDEYIGYLNCDAPLLCNGYRLSVDYKKGGKWYESEAEK